MGLLFRLSLPAGSPGAKFHCIYITMFILISMFLNVQEKKRVLMSANQTRVSSTIPVLTIWRVENTVYAIRYTRY